MSEAAVPGGFGGRLGAARLLSDARLTRRAVQGDERAFATIFDRYHQDLYRYCTAILGNSTDAQDALQNTMVKVLRALPGEERQIELKPWLYRIAHNEAIELMRRRRPAEELEPELLAGQSAPAEEAETRERLRRLIADLDQLPERQRGALVMRELGGLGFDEIAASLGTSEGVARQTVYEARLSLRQMDEGREMSCETVTRALSERDGRVTRRRDIRAHLRSCPDCRRFREEIAARHEDFAVLAPLPVVAAAGLLQGVLGGAGGSAASGAGLAGAVGGGAAKSLGAGAAIKSAAAVGAIAVVGAGAADRGGLVDATPWNGSQNEQSERGGGPHGAASRPYSKGAADPASGDASGASGSAALGQGAAADAGRRADPKGRRDDSSPGAAAGGHPPGLAGKGAGGTHPRGKGHEKQHPGAASQGQQTAAAHKASGQQGASNKRRPGGSRGGTTRKSPPGPVKPVRPSGSSAPQPNRSPASGRGAAVPPKAQGVPEAVPPPAPPPPTPPGQTTEPKPRQAPASLSE